MTQSNPRIPFCLSSDRPPLPAPDGRPLIIHVVANLEHWPFDQPMPRALFSAPHGKTPWPDLGNFAWVEYGLRCGAPRLARVIKESGIAASTTLNASVIDVYPRVAELALEAGWEVIGHAIYQRSLLLEEDERTVIHDSMSRLERFVGKRPLGWLGPGFGESIKTPEYLKEAGIDHIYDWALDDLPTWMYTQNGPLIAMPYALEVNDVMTFALEKHAGLEFYQRCCDAVEVLGAEVRHQPRVMTIGLHPHIIGVPHRLKYLSMTLEMLKARKDTIFMTGSQIADWFKKHSKVDLEHA